MSVEYSAQMPIATWNRVLGVWEAPLINLICEHWEPWREVWPNSGMTVGGQLFALPTPARHIDANASSSLPTPTARDYKDGNKEHRRNGVTQTDTLSRAVFVNELLPTPQVDDSKNTGHNQGRRTTLASEVWETERSTNWGKFAPAIARWESILGRSSPEPTKPDGKNGARRLSSKFTEFLMGLPDGWVTDIGLTRKQELKACGNGVVPQQAEAALRELLDGLF